MSYGVVLFLPCFFYFGAHITILFSVKRLLDFFLAILLLPSRLQLDDLN